MRNTRFLAHALASAGLVPANEEHTPDAGDMAPNATASAAQVPVQGVDAVAQAQIEPVVAAPGGEQSAEGKPAGNEESTVEVPDVDAVAQLQEHIGALEEQAYETDQQELQMVSNQFEDELAEATDVVASLESLGEQIKYALENNEVNASTNGAFYSTLVETVKRSGLGMAALEDGEPLQLTHEEAAGRKGAESIGQKVKNFASAAGNAIVQGIVKFLAWVQDVFSKFTTGAADLQKRFEEFEKSGLSSLSGQDISNSVLIQRLRLVRGSGDAPAQFNAFVRFCSERLLKTLAGPVVQIAEATAKGLKPGAAPQAINGAALDRMISLLYPEGVEQADLQGKTEIGTDWAQGSTGPLLGGLRAWIASNHNVVDNPGQTKIDAGISRDVETEAPGSIAGADANTARGDVRAIISILRNWSHLNIARRMGSVQSVVAGFVANSSKQQSAVDGEEGQGSIGSDGTDAQSVLRQYSQVLRGFCGQNTLSLIRHMLHTFALYHAYLQASTKKQEAATGNELQTA